MGETKVPTDASASSKSAEKDSKSSDSKKKAVQLGDFKLKKKLGQGGMGEVYLANQVSLDRLVALKILSKEMAKKAGFVERFVREARAMARIDHPNAVKIYAAESDKGLHYVAIEYIDGKSMQDWIDKLGKLEIGDAIHVIQCCADALRSAHDLNLIHRDIKPDNILVTKKGVVKVSDFGLAKALDDADMSMTQSGTGLGTPLYMPPEQARDAKNVDHRTDIYALGCTFYYFLTGQLPFTGDTVLKLIISKEKGQYESVRKHNSAIPERLELMVDKMIQKDPKHRYATCDEMMADLDKLGLENESLSFITGEDSSLAGGARQRTRSRVGSSSGGTQTSGVSMPAFRTSAEDAQMQQKGEIDEKVVWYVQYKDAKGQPQVKEMTTRQVQQGILAEIFDVKAQAQQKDKTSGFSPLAAHPEFQDLMKKRIAKSHTEVRSTNMKEMYAKIDKEQRSRKKWRWFRNMTENMLGGFGFIVYLIVVALLIVGLYFGVMWGYAKLSDRLDNSEAPSTPNATSPDGTTPSGTPPPVTTP